MKRFLLFSGHTYYACGGAFDYDDSFASLEEAVIEGERLEKAYTVDWWHVFDLDDAEIKAQSKTQAHC